MPDEAPHPGQMIRAIRSGFGQADQARVLQGLAHGILDDAASAFTEIPPLAGAAVCPMYILFAHGPAAFYFQALIARAKRGIDETIVSYESTRAPAPSLYDIEQMEAILGGAESHFSAHLFRLIKRCDAEHRDRLRLVYPAHVAAVENWETPAPPPPPIQF